MTTASILLFVIPVAYLLGSIPFGLIIGLWRGVDPRTAGSGNIGATNVGRLLGGRFFALVFTLDLLKGLIPMLLASWVVHRTPLAPGAEYDWQTCVLWLLAGFAAILGHMFSLFLGFKGGKGVATSAGVILGLYPFYTLPAVMALGVWGVVFLIWRYVSLASMVAAAAFPLLYVGFGLWRGWRMFGQQIPLVIFALLVAAMVIIRHKSNISRLLEGTEHGFRRPAQ